MESCTCYYTLNIKRSRASAFSCMPAIGVRMHVIGVCMLLPLLYYGFIHILHVPAILMALDSAACGFYHVCCHFICPLLLACPVRSVKCLQHLLAVRHLLLAACCICCLFNNLSHAVGVALVWKAVRLHSTLQPACMHEKIDGMLSCHAPTHMNRHGVL